MSCTTSDSTIDKRTETREYSHKGRGSCQHSSKAVNTGAVESIQFEKAEAKQQGVNAESSSIFLLNTTERALGILQISGFLRLGLETLPKKVRFKDEILCKVSEEPACLGREVEERRSHPSTKDQVRSWGRTFDIVALDLYRSSYLTSGQLIMPVISTI